MNWVKLKKYCALKGDTPDAVHAKRRRGIWIDGVQCKIANDGSLWVDMDAVDQWVQNSTRATQKSLSHAA